MPLQILIVDDERLVRSDFRIMLEEHSDIAIVAEANSVDAAIALLPDIQPDAVFLDIQMPRKLGFELLPHLPPKTHVIFVTAFDEYAVRAFEVNSLDYLLKPVVPERLSKTLERLRQRNMQIEVSHKALSGMSYNDQLFVWKGRYAKFIRLADVRFFRVAGIYSEIVVSENEIYLDNRSLQNWQEHLPEEFVRFHRSSIINTKHIESVQLAPNGLYQIFLTTFTQAFPVSRRQGKHLKALLG